MTDLEMTILCAEAMGLPEIQPRIESDGKDHGRVGYRTKPGVSEWLGLYAPLRDDAQAMALVKKLRLNIGPIWRDSETYWAVSFPVRNGPTEWFESEDLNRAIVECVATANRVKDDGTEKR